MDINTKQMIGNETGSRFVKQCRLRFKSFSGDLQNISDTSFESSIELLGGDRSVWCKLPAGIKREDVFDHVVG